MGRLDEGPSHQDEDEGWQEGEPGDHSSCHGTSQKQAIRTKYGLDIATDKANEGDNHDERPRCRFTQRQAINHLGRRQPAIAVHSPLIDIGQHGIGAAEGQQGSLGEEPAHLRQGVLPTVTGGQHDHRNQPQQHADESDFGQLAPGEQGMFRRRCVVVNQRSAKRLVCLAMAATGLELVGGNPSAHVADERGDRDDGRKSPGLWPASGALR